MRTQRSLIFSILFLLFATFSSAWPWPRWLPELDSLVVRQDNNNNNNDQTSPTQTPTPTASRPASRTSDNSDSNVTDPPKSNSDSESSATRSQSGTNTGTGGSGTTTGTGSQKSSSSRRSTSSKARTTSYDPRLPAGGVAMITPAVADGEQYYKVGDFITFRWNYTSLQATPTAVNVVATCKVNNQLYTIAMNQTVTNATQAVTWDTGNYQRTAASTPLIVEKYTLIIYDADSSISAISQAGYLAVFNQFTFGMYTPRPYVPLAEFVCVTCSGAFGEMERRAIGMVFGVGALTVLSFTWFVGGTGVIW